MSHIADLWNRGRMGTIQTLDQARGAYAQLIAKEHRISQMAFQRQLAERLDLHCPACDAKVCTPKCHVCGFFPIPMPKSSADLPPASAPRAASVASSRMSRTSSNGAATEEKLQRLEALILEEQAQQREVLTQIASLRKMLEDDLHRQEGEKAQGGADKAETKKGVKLPPASGRPPKASSTTHNRIPSAVRVKR